MMYSFEKNYKDLPRVLPLFPLKRVLLLPRAKLPLNLFENRYLHMFDHALSNDRTIGIIQPNEKICEAIKIMNQKNLSMLPVCEKKLFIGMLQKKFLTQYELKKNAIQKDNILFKQENRVIGNAWRFCE